MLTSIRWFTIWMLLLGAVGLGQTATADPIPSPGFLVIAPDHEYSANEQVKASWAEFRKAHLTRLVFISLTEDYEREVQARLEGAITEMRHEGAKEIVLIPFVLSEADPHMKKARDLLTGVEIRIAPVFGRDLLAGQMLEDRVRALSKEPDKERLLVIGFGSTNPEEAETMTRDLQRLAAEVQRTLHLGDSTTAVLYHGLTLDAIRVPGTSLAKTIIVGALEKTDLRAVVVPFDVGFTHAGLQLGHEVDSLLTSRAAAYDGRKLLPDPLVALWLRRVASQYLTLGGKDLGIVITTHGAGEYYNDSILVPLEPLRRKYNLEVSFGMADAETLQTAIDKVEARGARMIYVLRLYPISRSLQAETEFVLGLTNTSGPMHHAGKGGPSRVRSGALLSTGGGFDDHPLIAEVLLQRVLEVSQDPDRETVILLAHGAGNDEDNRFWIERMERQAKFIQTKTGGKFRAIKPAVVRENWPEKSKRAVAETRKMIEDASRDGGRALVISNRITGTGPYRRVLAGLDYTLNGQGIASHPNFARWIEEQIATLLTN